MLDLYTNSNGILRTKMFNCLVGQKAMRIRKI